MPISVVRHEEAWLQTYDLISIHDALEAMRDGEDSDILPELLTERLLDDCIRVVVYVLLFQHVCELN